jgi:hypothetical protein
MQRNNSFHRRTSFEENLLNDHLNSMKNALLDTGLQIKPVPLPSNDSPFAAVREKGNIGAIEENCYLLQ